MSAVVNFQQQPQAPQSGFALAMAEQQRAVAEVQSALVIAKQFPRDQAAAYRDIMQACKRTTLAEVALYKYARGGTEIEGPSIRLAEMLAQNWGNVEFGFRELSRSTDRDGIGYSEVQAYAWDMQTNTRRSMQFRARHWRDTKKGGYALTDERDIYELIANQASRRVRACILAIVPGDIVEAAVTQCNRTLVEGSEEPLADRARKMVAAFADLGVTQAMIEKHLQHKIDAVTPQQLAGLKKIYRSIRDGMGSIPDFFETDEPEEGPADRERPASRTDEVRQRVQQAQQQQPASAAAAPPPRQAEPRQQQPEPPPEEPPVHHWPQERADLETGEVTWVDAEGTRYDPERHGWSKDNKPSVTSAGVFRAKRGAAKQEHDEPPQQPQPQQDRAPGPVPAADQGGESDPFDNLE